MPPYTNGHLKPHYTNDFVKEAPFYSGRGRPLRVVCIGAGAAGIYLGIKLPRSFRDGAVDLQVRPQRRPGFRSDVANLGSHLRSMRRTQTLEVAGMRMCTVS